MDELKDVIAANGMDGSKLAMKRKKRDRLENPIIEVTRKRAVMGEAQRRNP
ncbi:MAG: hypothetical protein LBF58_10195 [Deltaproteobacteria bacterium]|nr:hypothetical protein [Deltaproteobacteria bacterium]